MRMLFIRWTYYMRKKKIYIYVLAKLTRCPKFYEIEKLSGFNEKNERDAFPTSEENKILLYKIEILIYLFVFAFYATFKNISL